MRKISLGMLALALALALALVLAGCGEPKPEFDQEFDVTAANFATVMNSIRGTPGKYLLKFSGDMSNDDGYTLETAGVDITLRGTGASKITLSDNRTFEVKAGKFTVENITLTVAQGYNGGAPLQARGGTVEIKNGVTISNPGRNGVVVDNGGVFVMSGGVIENCGENAVGLGEGSASITITGGTIRNVEYHAVCFWEDSSGATLTISGGTIQNTGRNAINLENPTNATVNISGGIIENANDWIIATNATGVTINISGGTFRNDAYQGGVLLWERSKNIVLTISGGTFSGGDESGVQVNGTENTVTMTGGTINGSSVGVDIRGNNNTFSISRGTITATRFGVRVQRGTGHTVTKTGGTVTGGETNFYKNDDAEAVVTGF